MRIADVLVVVAIPVVRAFRGLRRSLNRSIYHRGIRLHKRRACLGKYCS